MNKDIIKSQASTIAKSFESLTTHKMQNSVALELVSNLYGFKNYNVLFNWLKPETALAELGQIEAEHAQDNMDNDYGSSECVIQTLNGNKIKCPAYPQECDYVRVTDRADHETAYWVSDEWEQDPQGVMGAFLGAVRQSQTREMPAFATQKATPMQAIKKPLNKKELLDIVENQNSDLKVVVGIDLSDLMEGIEAVNDQAVELIVGHTGFYLQDISYSVVGHNGDEVLIEVRAQLDHNY